MSQVEWGLLLLAIMSSAVTSALGAGGGLMLLVGLPNLVAAPLVIPIHGVSCLVSNFSRLAIDWRMVPWQKVMLPYLPGALIGGVLGYFALGRFSVDFLPIILGVFILLVTWTQWVQRFGMWLHNMSLLGGVQTFFALFVGTLGWLSAPILLQKGLKKDQVIVTQSAIMGLMNTLKVIVFVAAGFAYLQHSALILIMLVGALFGNLLGRVLRTRINEKIGVQVIRWVISVLAIQLIVMTIIKLT